MDRAVNEKFVELEHHSMILVEGDPEKLLQRFETYHPPVTDKAKWALNLSKDV